MTAEDQLFGLDEPAARLARLYGRGQDPSALILHGPAQIGKALLVARLASALLQPQPPREAALAGFHQRPASSLVQQRAHPDLCWLARERNDRGQLRQQILVDQVQRLLVAVQQTAAMAQIKLAVVEDADCLNAHAANALLKRLEEPTGAVRFILITSALGRLLPTIRSRAQRLAIPALSQADFQAWQRSAGMAEPQGASLFALAEGAPGRARDLIERDLLTTFAQLPMPGQPLALAELRQRSLQLAAAAPEDPDQVKGQFLATIAAHCRQLAHSGDGQLPAALQRYDRVRELIRNADRLNLDEQMLWIRLLSA